MNCDLYGFLTTDPNQEGGNSPEGDAGYPYNRGRARRLDESACRRDLGPATAFARWSTRIVAKGERRDGAILETLL